MRELGAYGSRMAETVGATQQLEEDILQAASSLVEQQERRVERSDPAGAVAARLRVLAAVQLNRQHNEHCSPLLLRLPNNALELIARKMGKRARLICSKLCLTFGSPGAVLAPAVADPYNPPKMHSLAPVEAAAMQSWRHPVRLLDLSNCLLTHKHQGITFALALPTLRELRCKDFPPAYATAAPVLPHPSLTSLHARCVPYDLRCVAACAPLLRSLHVGEWWTYEGYGSSKSTPSMVWDALASLPSLQSLHLPLSSDYLTPSSGFCSALEQLTALTHLGLVLQPAADGTNTLPPNDALQATGALSALPLLASINISNFGMLGHTLGRALQALPKLRVLALDHKYMLTDLLDYIDDDTAPGLPAGCLPSFSALRGLEELTLTGGGVVGSQELRRASGGALPPLQALVLQLTDERLVPGVCDLLALQTARTSLGLLLCSGAYVHQEGRLGGAVAQLTQLRHLHVRSMDGEFVPCSAPLPALTCLEMHLLARAGPVWSDLHAVEALTSLRRLVLMSDRTTAAKREQYMEAVRKLPLLEDVEVGCAQWTGANLGLLLPPPGRLTRLLLAMYFASSSWSDLVVPSRGVADAVEQLESHGVHVILRHGRV